MGIIKVIKNLIKSFAKNIFFLNKRMLKKYTKEAELIIKMEDQIKSLTDEELKQKTIDFKQLLSNKEATIGQIKHEAFAVAREAARRVLGQLPYKVQIIGALALHDGHIAEMKTGEGKTLTSTMAIYLNALTGKGVHIVTVNEYLATRDANWMGQIFKFLGLSVGVSLKDNNLREKQAAYACDITYTTNSELGFDYLRDNMIKNKEEKVLRDLNFIIIDEADSILIDESRTPLIISGGKKTSENEYVIVDKFVKTLKKDQDFLIDLKDMICYLSDAGAKKAEKAFSIQNIYDSKHTELLHHIYQSLRANFIMVRDVEYTVINSEIQIIDQFTGRILKNMEYSDGLHQAIQAKENVKIKPETRVLATITYQNFFRLYKKMSGMTGTAKTEEEEFQKIYNMDVICVPTNKPIIRTDAIDRVFVHKQPKLDAIVNEIKERHKKGQPILVGTTSVESSEEISKLLTKNGLKHEVLNAKNHMKEAAIIAQAGKKNQITIATNMAGRGTDIKIDKEVVALGGLCVLGTERHEARRIDNQLRGRAGRQGDPGFTRFFVSFDDSLMKRFASERMMKYYESLGSESLESRLLMHVITNAQKQIEGKNFDVRKNVLDYDNVLSKQREIIYAERYETVCSNNIDKVILDFFYNVANNIVKSLSNSEEKSTNNEILKYFGQLSFMQDFITKFQNNDVSEDKASNELKNILFDFYDKLREEVGKDIVKSNEKNIILDVIDQNWTRHIDHMSNLREGIYLRGYANVNPLQAYVNEGYTLFKDMFSNISVEATCLLLKRAILLRKNKIQTRVRFTR
ncbi:MAG: preprotein translocase subunit SecA [Bacilli bacterium]|nr:preprotein translocase subunit SecA [Bacilli bacterium]